MSVFICELQGARGRSMKLYDNKCVITTDVTLGSLLTNNALDGMKTVFFADVVGVQYKQGGVTLGYLQLETPSSQMNNKASNMFSENTFTFDPNLAGNPKNEIMDLIHDFIIDRLEGYKYGGGKNLAENPPMELLKKLDGAYISISHDLRDIVKKYEADQEQRKKEEEQQRKIEKEKEMQRLREMRVQYQNDTGDDALRVFLNEAQSKTRILEVYELWKQLGFEENEVMADIGSYLKDRAFFERSYGSSERYFKKTMEGLIKKIEG